MVRRSFYLRTGKRMLKKLSEIVIYYKSVPHRIFGEATEDTRPNKLVEPSCSPMKASSWY